MHNKWNTVGQPPMIVYMHSANISSGLLACFTHCLSHVDHGRDGSGPVYLPALCECADRAQRLSPYFAEPFRLGRERGSANECRLPCERVRPMWVFLNGIFFCLPPYTSNVFLLNSRVNPSQRPRLSRHPYHRRLHSQWRYRLQEEV